MATFSSASADCARLASCRNRRGVPVWREVCHLPDNYRHRVALNKRVIPLWPMIAVDSIFVAELMPQFLGNMRANGARFATSFREQTAMRHYGPYHRFFYFVERVYHFHHCGNSGVELFILDIASNLLIVACVIFRTSGPLLEFSRQNCQFQ